MRHSRWTILVAASAFVVLTAVAAIGAWWAVSTEERIGTYEVRGAVSGVALDLDAADAEIVGAPDNAPVGVRRTESFTFEHRPVIRRETTGGVLRISARCPELLLGACSASYRVAVPANVPVTVRTTSGDVRFAGYRGSARIDTSSGDVSVSGYCGNRLLAHARTGAVRATATCSPQRVELRSQEGDVHATVPAGRYRVDADSDDGERRVEGLVTSEEASFIIQALSGSGDVLVEAAS